MTAKKRAYHHGNLAESLLNAVDDIATEFGMEAVTLRACAKRVGVSPSSAFRHYTDKRALLTAFATRAITQLSESIEDAKARGGNDSDDAFTVVCLAYVAFALEKPAYFRAMWSEETIYTNDESYLAAAESLWTQLKGGFGETIDDEDPDEFSSEELLVWSSVHGLANLFVDGPLWKSHSTKKKLREAKAMIQVLGKTLNA